MGPRISVVVTILNEAKHLPDLLDSLAAQEPPFEVIVVDAGSTDASVPIVEAFAREHPEIRLLHHPGRRGASRNAGVAVAQGDYVAFVDGDCIANPFLLRRLREAAAPDRVVAGRTVLFGYWAFEKLQRVELEHRGHDVSVPSSNLLYPRKAFVDVGGFDPRFITAEDIDLNFRAVEAGLGIVHARNAVVYHRARDSVSGFLRQAYWNGYGRKQLTLKHGELWHEYSFDKMIRTNLAFWSFLRMGAAVLGYLTCRVREDPREWEATRVPSAKEVPA